MFDKDHLEASIFAVSVSDTLSFVNELMDHFSYAFVPFLSPMVTCVVMEHNTFSVAPSIFAMLPSHLFDTDNSFDLRCDRKHVPSNSNYECTMHLKRKVRNGTPPFLQMWNIPSSS